ncbi:MAG TPA: alanine--glyoxylate aminotransferase family protein [Bryobacteraceae bacterium]|nr:alanine--glyoxylate aminotransferase family protein [Bryobacteraceae bacterium]
MTQNPYRLRLPGPTAVPERVRQAMARPVLSHRGAEFVAILSRAEELLRQILGTSNPVIFLACSGTGVMEAGLVNILAAGERVLVCVNGQFGERFAAIAKALGATVDVLDVPWGQPLDPSAIERRVAAAEYRAVVAIHNESSTGVVADLAAIGKILRHRPTLLIVDSVSGLGGIEMRQDDWGVDIVASSSQKALMCPPGIGIASVSPKAWDIVKRDTAMPRFYWDFRKAMNAGEALETPFTPAVSMILGLREALEMIHEEGLEQVLARHLRLSAALRAGCAALGLSSFPQAGTLSNTVVALNVPENLNGGDIVRRLYEGYGTVIAGSRNKLAGRVIRIGTMGSIQAGDIVTDLLHMEAVLRELGSPVKTGAGVAAAVEVLDAR